MRLFSFAEQKTTLPLRVWQLNPGKYRIHTRSIAGESLAEQEVLISRAQIVQVSVPAGKEINLTIERAK